MGKSCKTAIIFTFNRTIKDDKLHLTEACRFLGKV